MIQAERLIEMTVERDILEAENLELQAQNDYYRERIYERITQ